MPNAEQFNVPAIVEASGSGVQPQNEWTTQIDRSNPIIVIDGVPCTNPNYAAPVSQLTPINTSAAPSTPLAESDP